MPPLLLVDRIKAYLEDHPGDGGHSDAAGATAFELLEEAVGELSRPDDDWGGLENEVPS